jgi:hypothetical protein
MNKDQKLIAEAYKSVYIKESVEDKNYVPSLEEVKDYLHQHYNNLKRYYTNINGLDILQKRFDNLDKTAKQVKQIIDDAKFEIDEWNHKYAKPDGRDAYTLWGRLYGDVSDHSKDLNGFRHRTNFQETPTIAMALNLKDIYDESKARSERRNLEWAGNTEEDNNID